MKNRIRPLLRNKYYLVLILILLAVFWIWWIPGPRVANDFSFISSDFLKLQFDVPRIWNERGAEGLGENGVFILWSYPVSFIFGILTNFGLNFDIWERILIFLYIILGSVSVWKFLSSYSLSDKSKFIGSLFYLINTYPILLIDGGQISIALAYALFPMCFLLVSKAVYLNVKKKILSGLFVTILGFFDIRFIYLLFFLFFIKSLFEILENKGKRLKILLNWFNTVAILGFVILVLNSFWFFAYLKTPIERDIFATFTKMSTNLLNIGHTFLVISPHWYKNVFGRISQLKFEFILLPVLIFLSPILRRKDKNVLFWLFVAFVAIFLAKGDSEPFSFIYPWLHSSIPGFSLFRDSTKFFFLIALSYSVLISISSEEIFKRFLSNKIKIVYIFFITAYLLCLIRPIFLNQMSGTFSMQPFEKEFQSLSDVLKNDNSFGRVFWIPSTAPLAYSDLNHPIVEAARVFSRRPFVDGIKGAYEVFNFLREASYMGEIFDISAISYISYPYLDPRRDDFSPDDKKYYGTFLSQLNSLPWIERRILDSKVPLLKTKSHQDKLFITNRTWVVFGSDEIFNDATKSAKLRLANNAIIFAEKEIGLGLLISKYPEAKIVLNKKTLTDLIVSFIPQSQYIFPAENLFTTPNQTGWWKNEGKDLISWRDFLQTKYNIDSKEFDLGGGWAVGEGIRELKVENKKLKHDRILFARVLESSRGGSISFYQGDKLIGSIDTKLIKNNVVRWFEVGVLQKNSDLTIKTEGDINIINALVTVDPQDLLIYKRRVNDLEKQITDFKVDKEKEEISTLRYEKINQTKYKVYVSNLTSPKLIIFSSTFHPGWKLNGESSVPVYGFLNGFRVEKEGEYVLEFEPQKWINPGLIVSLITFLGLFVILL